MKRSTLFIVILWTIAACHSQVNAQNNEGKISLETVYNAYFVVKDALVKSDNQLVQRSAELLYSNISSISSEQLGPEEREIWAIYQKQLSADVEQIKKSTKIEQQRKYFALLSANMYEVMKNIKPSKTTYYQHCPMYDKGKGANWLSLEKDIKNPYYGSAMLSCGNTVEPIK